jgi:hypothetical protein
VVVIQNPVFYAIFKKTGSILFEIKKATYPMIKKQKPYDLIRFLWRGAW